LKLRHDEIEQDQVRRFAARLGQGFFTVHGDHHVQAGSLERSGGDLAQQQVVLGQEDFSGAGGHRVSYTAFGTISRHL
jgi:hypothetical protein